MAYNEELGERIRPILAEKSFFDEKKMFGGVCFLINGNMCCGIHKESLILRLGPETALEALSLQHCRVFDITGRPMKGWVMVDPPGYENDTFLKEWVLRAYDFSAALPSK